MSRKLRWGWLDRRAYRPTWELQERLRAEIKTGRGEEHLLLLEHDPVFTVGRNASRDDLLADPLWLAARGIEVIETNRGGQLTYHGPGQLVGYPILDLDPDRRDVRRYVRDLQEVLIRVLAEHGIMARRREEAGMIGVWVEEAKIASIGVHLSRWVTLHGFALNVSTDLSSFEGIVPCGLRGVKMTSIETLLGKAPALPELAGVVARCFGEVFGRELVPLAPEVVDYRSTQ